MSAAGPGFPEAGGGVDGLPPLRDVIRRHDLAARRSLGQNFLLDLNLTGRIARAGGPLDGVTVIEVGPGPGGLTRALIAEGAAQVIAIERDERCLAALEEIAQAAPGRLQVIAGDALKTDYAALVSALPATLPAALPATVSDPARGPAQLRIIANLPYNIGTALLVDWLTAPAWPPWYGMLVLMFQREVAERIVAAPGSKSYGRLAVLAQWRTEPRIVFDVAPSAFVPPPKVTSSVVRLVPRPAPLPCDLSRLERVTAAAFGQRRKMLRQSLRALGRDPAPLLAQAGIAETERAENVSVEGFVALACALERAERTPNESHPAAEP